MDYSLIGKLSIIKEKDPDLAKAIEIMIDRAVTTYSTTPPVLADKRVEPKVEPELTQEKAFGEDEQLPDGAKVLKPGEIKDYDNYKPSAKNSGVANKARSALGFNDNEAKKR